MDPLSEVLSLLKPQSYISKGFEMDTRAAIQWPDHPGIKCYAVISGQCWLSVEGVAGPTLIEAGDCFLLPPGPPFCLATDRSATPIDFRDLLSGWTSQDEGFNNKAGRCYLFGGHFILTGRQAGILLKSLPPIVHIQNESGKAAMRWSLECMKEEMRNPQPGASLIGQQLAYMMLVQALRLHLAGADSGSVGWLFALADNQMSTAITCMHENPGHPWTLQTLAAHVGMSRSVFALKFKGKVGMSPLEYLTQWRMLLAGDRLENSGDSVSEIASSLGYESESAFGKAFRRVMGCSPRRYSHQSAITPRSPVAQDGRAAARLQPPVPA